MNRHGKVTQMNFPKFLNVLIPLHNRLIEMTLHQPALSNDDPNRTRLESNQIR